MAIRKIIVTEDILLSLLQSKDIRGFSILYDNYSSSLYGIILKIVHTDKIATELMQDTFLNVSLNIEKYSQTNENLFTWICSIARKLAIDKINTKEFKHSMPNNGVFSTIKSNNQHGNSQVNIDVNNEEIVVRNIYPKYEKVIELIYFQGFTQAKIANELNIPLGMVKEYVRTAIIELRKYFI